MTLPNDWHQHDVIIPDADTSDASADVIVAGLSSANVVSPCDVTYDASEDSTLTVADEPVKQWMWYYDKRVYFYFSAFLILVVLFLHDKDRKINTST